MILKSLNILNYKNIEEARLSFSPRLNALVGHNGMGKTNVLDAIYYLAFCRSTTSTQDAHNVRHDAPDFMLDATLESDAGAEEHLVCAYRNGGQKRVAKNGKSLRRLSDHVGSVPLVMVSPYDVSLAEGSGEGRRAFMDAAISQYDKAYLESLIRYERALKQRNALLRGAEEGVVDWSVAETLEDMMSLEAEVIYAARREFVEAFVPVFRDMYASFCDNASETSIVDITLQTHAERGSLRELLRAGRQKEAIVGHTLYGPHRDDLLLTLGGYPVRREASQGQTKTYAIAMKLAQYLLLKQRHGGRTPLLLLDDIFDKLDRGRVERIVQFAAQSPDLGQVFITDTNRDHLDRLLAASREDYRLFYVEDGRVSLSSSSETPATQPLS
ncbi:MAG: DNA replication and repair protein RecF [Alloprevotella sp.]|nr:DNA replication and repair protein RecF [Alloprevotella sp.]